MTTQNARDFVNKVVNDPVLVKALGLKQMNFAQVIECAAQEGYPCSETEMLSILRLYMVDELSLPQWLAYIVQNLAIWHRWEVERHIESQNAAPNETHKRTSGTPQDGTSKSS